MLPPKKSVHFYTYRGNENFYTFHPVHPDSGTRLDHFAGCTSGAPFHGAQLYLTGGSQIVDLRGHQTFRAGDAVHIGFDLPGGGRESRPYAVVGGNGRKISIRRFCPQGWRNLWRNGEKTRSKL